METGSCVYPPEYSDADWYRKDIKYAVDKSLEFSEVLFTSTGDVNIYGSGERLYTKNGMNKTTYINGLNKSVYETVDMKFDFYGCRETSKEYSYTDTGYSKEHKFGYGYNGETLDDTGLIYLRARYYNPRIGQFIQLDNTYKGEQDSIESQNRYAYTMNNPYKYVDRGGNKSIKTSINPVDFLKKQTEKKAKKIVNNVLKVTNNIASLLNKYKEKEKHNEEISNSNGINNSSSKTQDETRKRLEKMNKALEAMKAEPCPDIDLRKTQWNTFFGTYHKVNKIKFNVEVYKHVNVKSQTVMLAGSSNKPNYQAMWTARKSYMAASTLYNFAKTLCTLGVDELTTQTIKEIASKYSDIAMSKVKIKLLLNYEKIYLIIILKKMIIFSHL